MGGCFKGETASWKRDGANGMQSYIRKELGYAAAAHSEDVFAADLTIALNLNNNTKVE